MVQGAFVLSCALTPVPVSSPSAQPHVFFMRSLSCRSLVYFLYLLCLCPIAPLPTPCLSCARALLLTRRCSASSASRSTAPSITSCLPVPVFFRLDLRVLPPSLQGSFRLYLASFRLIPRVFSSRTSCLFVSSPVSFRLVPRVFSSRTPCPLVLSPGFFRPQPRVISSPIPELSFVCFRNLLLPRKRFSC